MSFSVPTIADDADFRIQEFFPTIIKLQLSCWKLSDILFKPLLPRFELQLKFRNVVCILKKKTVQNLAKLERSVNYSQNK